MSLLGSATEATDGFIRLPTNEAIDQLLNPLVEEVKAAADTLANAVETMRLKPTVKNGKGLLLAKQKFAHVQAKLQHLTWTAADSLASQIKNGN